MNFRCFNPSLKQRKLLFRNRNAEPSWQMCARDKWQKESPCCQRGSGGLRLCNETWSKVLSAGPVFVPRGQNTEKSREVTVNRSWWNNWSHTQSLFTQVSAHTAGSHTKDAQTRASVEVFKEPLPDCCVSVMVNVCLFLSDQHVSVFSVDIFMKLQSVLLLLQFCTCLDVCPCVPGSALRWLVRCLRHLTPCGFSARYISYIYKPTFNLKSNLLCFQRTFGRKNNQCRIDA